MNLVIRNGQERDVTGLTSGKEDYDVLNCRRSYILYVTSEEVLDFGLRVLTQEDTVFLASRISDIIWPQW